MKMTILDRIKSQDILQNTIPRFLIAPQNSDTVIQRLIDVDALLFYHAYCGAVVNKFGSMSAQAIWVANTYCNGYSAGEGWCGPDVDGALAAYQRLVREVRPTHMFLGVSAFSEDGQEGILASALVLLYTPVVNYRIIGTSLTKDSVGNLMFGIPEDISALDHPVCDVFREIAGMVETYDPINN